MPLTTIDNLCWSLHSSNLPWHFISDIILNHTDTHTKLSTGYDGKKEMISSKRQEKVERKTYFLTGFMGDCKTTERDQTANVLHHSCCKEERFCLQCVWNVKNLDSFLGSCDHVHGEGLKMSWLYQPKKMSVDGKDGSASSLCCLNC